MRIARTFYVAAALLVSLAPALGQATSSSPTLVKSPETSKTATSPAARPLLRGDYSAITDMAGSLVKSVAGAALTSILFPSKTIDTDKLLADISVNVRKELVKNVTDGDETALTAAATALADYELEFKNDPTLAADIEGRLANSSTINSIDTVIARTGAAGKSEYVEPGLPIFVAAAQLKANRLELRRKLLPSHDAAVRAVLIAHLEDSLAHARKTLHTRRAEAMEGRLGKITPCYIGSNTAHGPPWDLIWTARTYFNDSDDPAATRGGSQADNDQGKALARCEGRREPYVDGIRRARATVVDKPWLSTQQTLDLWAQALDTLRAAGHATARASRIHFGGMYGIGERAFNNPLTGGQSCPAGYTAFEFKGTYNVDWPAYYCGRLAGDGDPVADFGGMYGRTNHNDPGEYPIHNAITGASTCPAGFSAADVNNQHSLTYCWRRHTAGQKEPYLFGGLYSDNGDKKNPITDRMLCPVGYSPSLVHGTFGASGVPSTRRVVMCTATNI